MSTLANNWSPVPCPVPQCDTEPKLFEARLKEPHNRRCGRGGEEDGDEGGWRGGRTRERLHCETAISRDEAFLNKQIKKEKAINTVLVYQEESSSWLWSIYFLLHCFFFLVISNVWGPYWQSNLVWRSEGGVPARPISSPGRWCVHCVCGGQRIQRFGVVMNPDRPVLPSVVDSAWGCCGGEATRRVWQSRAGPCGSRRASTSLDRSVLAQRAEEMGRELVDMWTAAASPVDMCLDTRGDVF